MESGSSYCFYLGLSIANSSCSFFFNQLVCCGSWFKFTWQLQAKLTAHSWCWEHFCDVETILTHPTDYSWSPPNFRQPKTSVSSAKWWHQAYDYHHHHNLLVVDHCQWQCRQVLQLTFNSKWVGDTDYSPISLTRVGEPVHGNARLRRVERLAHPGQHHHDDQHCLEKRLIIIFRF